MNDSSGISSMPPESDGFKRTPPGVPATLSHVSLLGLSAQRHRATENFGSPVRKAANRASSDAHEHLRTLTGIFGFHRNLRVPTQNLRVLELPSGVRRQPLQTRAFRGSSHTVAVARRTSVLHPCVIIATEHLRTLTGIFGFHPNLLEIQKPPSKVTA